MFQEVETPRYQDIRHTKVVRLLALGTGRICPLENIPGTHFCQRLLPPQDRSVARWIMSMKNSIDTAGNSTSDLLAFSYAENSSALVFKQICKSVLLCPLE